MPLCLPGGCAGMEGPVNVFHQDNGLGDGVKLWW